MAEIVRITRKKTKFDIQDLKGWSFKSKDPKERNVAKKIDQIVYGI